jgi:HK97 gp10 family phage protein
MIVANLTSRIPEIIASIPDELGAILEDGANAVAEDAQSRVPVETGRLRDAIHVEQLDDLTFSVVAGDEDAYYGHVVENGSVTTAPRPFLVPAAEAQRDALDAAAMKALGEV